MESGADLYYFRARDYSPLTGRFLSADPKQLDAGDLNMYRFALNAPFVVTDPTGEDAIVEGATLEKKEAATLSTRAKLGNCIKRLFVTVGLGLALFGGGAKVPDAAVKLINIVGRSNEEKAKRAEKLIKGCITPNGDPPKP